MNIRFLGTGDAGGVPLFGCNCALCVRAKKGQGIRRPSSIILKAGKERLLIDAGRMDLAEIVEAEAVERILLTHYHVDHVQGLFHLRWGKRECPIPVNGPKDEQGCADLHKHSGILDFSETLAPFSLVHFGSLSVTAVPLNHSKPTLGYCIEFENKRLAYITDTLGLPNNTEKFLKEWQPTVLILDCSHSPSEMNVRNHNNLTMALSVHNRIKPEATWLTHIGHDMDVYRQSHVPILPKNVGFAFDEQLLSI